MSFIEIWLYWTQVACVLMSLTLAAFMLWRYHLMRRAHILVWAVAWTVVALRVAVGLLFPFSFLREYINDLLTITGDLIWFLGLTLILEVSEVKKTYFPITYLSIFSITASIIYFGLNDRMLGAIVTTIFAHPALLFMLSWYFHICARVTGYLGARIISFSFLLWAMDYIIFGVPYFGAGIDIAGVLGWNIGLVFRVMILLGFLMIVLRRK